MATLKDCEVCTKPCPQADMAHEAGMGRYYATQELIKLQKRIDAGELVEVVRCKRCKRRFKNLGCPHSLAALNDDHFCGYGEKEE